MVTVLDTIHKGAGFLEKKGVEEARLNMEHLLAHVLGLKRLNLYLEFDRPLEEGELEPLRDLLKKRGEGVPLQHLLGEVEFAGETFKVDGRALVPRPETEEMLLKMVELWTGRVEALAEERSSADKKVRVLDWGTGSGVLGLSLAKAWGEAVVVDLVDASAEALSLARENAKLLGVAEQVRFFESKGLAKVEVPVGGYEVVVSNPPYIPRAEVETLSREVKHDPVLALDGGASGLEVVEDLLKELKDHVSDDVVLAMEFGAGQEGEVEVLLERHWGELAGKSHFFQDFSGIVRYVMRHI